MYVRFPAVRENVTVEYEMRKDKGIASIDIQFVWIAFKADGKRIHLLVVCRRDSLLNITTENYFRYLPFINIALNVAREVAGFKNVIIDAFFSSLSICIHSICMWMQQFFSVFRGQCRALVARIECSGVVRWSKLHLFDPVKRETPISIWHIYSIKICGARDDWRALHGCEHILSNGTQQQMQSALQSKVSLLKTWNHFAYFEKNVNYFKFCRI